MFIARRVIQDGGLTRRGVAEAVVAWYDFVDGDHILFVGPSTRRAVAKIRTGADLALTGLGGDTNGAAMRVSVVGCAVPGRYRGRGAGGRRERHPDAQHAGGLRQRCRCCCCDCARACAGVELRDVLLAGVEGADAGHALGHVWLGASVARRIEFAVSLARDQHGDDASRLKAIYDLIGTSLAASEAVPAAFALVALADGDPLRAAQTCLRTVG